MGHKVFVVNSCISDSEYGYKRSLFLWDKNSNKESIKNTFINRFVHKKMYISLIKTRNWARNLLNADEEENIYREAISILNLQKITCTLKTSTKCVFYMYSSINSVFSKTLKPISRAHSYSSRHSLFFICCGVSMPSGP